MFSNILFLVIFYMFFSILGNFHFEKFSNKTKCLGKEISSSTSMVPLLEPKEFTMFLPYLYIFDSANSLVVDPYEEVCLEDMSWIKM